MLVWEFYGGEGCICVVCFLVWKLLEEFDFEYVCGFKCDIIVYLGILDFIIVCDNVVFLGFVWYWEDLFCGWFGDMCVLGWLLGVVCYCC